MSTLSIVLYVLVGALLCPLVTTSGLVAPDVHPQCTPVHPLCPLKELEGQSSSLEGENASLLWPVCSRLPLCWVSSSNQVQLQDKPTTPSALCIPREMHPHAVSPLFHCTPSLAEDLLPVYSLFTTLSFVFSFFFTHVHYSFS